MSSAYVQLGPDARIDVNGVAYGSVSGTVEIQRDVATTTTTEDGSPKARASPLAKCTANIEAQLAKDVNYFSPGLNVMGVDAFNVFNGPALTIWTNGRGDASRKITLPHTQVRSVTLDWR